jgi:flagellar basal-body rod protein FlgB
VRFIERLLNQGNAPLIEQAVRFSAARHKLLAENIANASTPGYRQKDLSVDNFRAMLRRRVIERNSAPPGSADMSVTFEPDDATGGIVFHDRNNRSMEQLMTDSVSNALYHNMMLEMLRKQYSSIEAALKERIG